MRFLHMWYVFVVFSIIIYSLAESGLYLQRRYLYTLYVVPICLAPITVDPITAASNMYSPDSDNSDNDGSDTVPIASASENCSSDFCSSDTTKVWMQRYVYVHIEIPVFLFDDTEAKKRCQPCQEQSCHRCRMYCCILQGDTLKERGGAKRQYGRRCCAANSAHECFTFIIAKHPASNMPAATYRRRYAGGEILAAAYRPRHTDREIPTVFFCP